MPRTSHFLERDNIDAPNISLSTKRQHPWPEHLTFYKETTSMPLTSHFLERDNINAPNTHFLERGNIDAPNISLSGLGTGTSIKMSWN
jgi:hypothetical protein